MLEVLVAGLVLGELILGYLVLQVLRQGAAERAVLLEVVLTEKSPRWAASQVRKEKEKTIQDAIKASEDSGVWSYQGMEFDGIPEGL